MADNKTTEGAQKKGKQNGYSNAHLHAKRNRKRTEAEGRQRDYDKLTLKEKLERAKSRGGSVREIARLEAKLKPKAKAPTAKPTLEKVPVAELLNS